MRWWVWEQWIGFASFLNSRRLSIWKSFLGYFVVHLSLIMSFPKSGRNWVDFVGLGVKLKLVKKKGGKMVWERETTDCANFHWIPARLSLVWKWTYVAMLKATSSLSLSLDASYALRYRCSIANRIRDVHSELGTLRRRPDVEPNREFEIQKPNRGSCDQEVVVAAAVRRAVERREVRRGVGEWRLREIGARQSGVAMEAEACCLFRV